MCLKCICMEYYEMIDERKSLQLFSSGRIVLNICIFYFYFLCSAYWKISKLVFCCSMSHYILLYYVWKFQLVQKEEFYILKFCIRIFKVIHSSIIYFYIYRYNKTAIKVSFEKCLCYLSIILLLFVFCVWKLFHPGINNFMCCNSH